MEEASPDSSRDLETRMIKSMFNYWQKKYSARINRKLASIGNVLFLVGKVFFKNKMNQTKTTGRLLDSGEPFKIEFQNGISPFEFDAMVKKKIIFKNLFYKK